MPDDLENEGALLAPDTEPILSSVPDTMKATDDLTRRVVAYVLLALIFVIVAIAFADLFIIDLNAPAHVSDDEADRLMKLMDVVFGPIVTLFSSVVGFYFGARTAKDAKG
jgi:uncharacterized RDD family membrane protein YckC